MRPHFLVSVGIFCVLFVGCRAKQHLPAHTQIKTEPLSNFVSGSEDEFFILHEGEVPWGDYGHILTQGMTGHLARSGSHLQLERTGPFVPPITFPGSNIVVTTEMKDAMQAAGFRGIEFRSVLKVLIVDLDWRSWDLKANDPKVYPADGEPENYLIDQKHSERVSRQIGDLWEVVLSPGVQMDRIKKPGQMPDVEFHYIPGTRNDADLFLTAENGYKYCSLRAKLWFDRYFPEWTSFKPISK